jgi:hypothetical protein
MLQGVSVTLLFPQNNASLTVTLCVIVFEVSKNKSSIYTIPSVSAPFFRDMFKSGQLTDIERCVSNDTQRTAHRTQGAEGTRDSENTHGKVDLKEDDSGSLPADGSELNAVDVLLENLPRLTLLSIGARRLAIMDVAFFLPVRR